MDQAGGGLLSRTGMFPQMSTGMMPAMPTGTNEQFPPFGSPSTIMPGLPTAAAAPSVMGMMNTTTSQTAVRSTTGGLMVPGQQGSNTVKLTGPVKVVQVPVAGQPGRFVTGIMPVAPHEQAGLLNGAAKNKKGGLTKIIGTVLALLIIFGGVGIYMQMHTGRSLLSLGSAQSNGVSSTANLGTPNGIGNSMSTAANPATATAAANILISDPLSQNTHGWQSSPSNVYTFKEGAYHITNRENVGQMTILPLGPLTGPMVYTLTMEQIAGDTTTSRDSFGLVVRLTHQLQGTKDHVTFYSFEVQNTRGGQYNFWKYDDANKGWGNPLWSGNIGSEYHQGLGAANSNTLKVAMDGDKFTLIVNGATVQTVRDKSFPTGMVGMVVNQSGTEVAFKNLYLTRS
jgi:hypothetical protein